MKEYIGARVGVGNDVRLGIADGLGDFSFEGISGNDVDTTGIGFSPVVQAERAIIKMRKERTICLLFINTPLINSQSNYFQNILIKQQYIILNKPKSVNVKE
jgi:hypothetical protein